MVMKCDVLSVTVNINQFGCFLPDGVLNNLTFCFQRIIKYVMVKLNNFYHLIIIILKTVLYICLFIKMLTVTVTIAALYSIIIFLSFFESYFHNNPSFF